MKKTLELVIVIFSILTVSSCETRRDIEPQKETSIKYFQSFTDYLGRKGKIISFVYDKNNKVDSMQLDFGNNGAPVSYYHKMNYNNEGFLTSSDISVGPSLNSIRSRYKEMYEYNSKGLLSKISRQDNQPFSLEVFYNNENEVSRIISQWGIRIDTFNLNKGTILLKNLVYDSKNNLVSNVYDSYSFTNENRINYKQDIQYQYDINPNPLLYFPKFKGFPKQPLLLYAYRAFFDTDAYFPFMIPTNNVISKIRKRSDLGILDKYEYKYEYDEKGLPIKTTQIYNDKMTLILENAFLTR